MKLQTCDGLVCIFIMSGLWLVGCASPQFRGLDCVAPISAPLPITAQLQPSTTSASQATAAISPAAGSVKLVSDQSTPAVPVQREFVLADELSKSETDIPERIAAGPETADVDKQIERVNASFQADAERLARHLNWVGQYRIETGDSLEIKFRAVKELDEVVTVRPDGMISLQIVGDQAAAGLTPEQLRRQLEAAYSKDFVTSDLAVIVRSFSGNSIYIGGEVAQPIRVALTGRVTTLRAIILAGGFKDTADRRRVVVRHEDGSCCQYDLKSVIECKSRNQDIELRPYDIVYVPKSRIAKVNLFVEQYIDKVLPFSRSFGVFITQNTGLPNASGP